MSKLPPAATEASHVRYRVANELARLCPQALGREIVLTGSVARGVADEYSDIEQVFYVDVMPSISKRRQWLQEIGAGDVIIDTEPIADGSSWATFLFRGTWIEAGWQTIDAHEKNLQAVLNGETIDHRQLMLAEMTAHAVSLSGMGLLEWWQQELMYYPEMLAGLLIAEAIEPWRFPHVLISRRALVARGERLALMDRLVGDTQSVLRILFALNREWEPDWKWLQSVTGCLSIKPERLIERIDEMFSTAQLDQALAACIYLILDTLSLVPGEYDVARAMRVVQEFLQVLSQLQPPG